MIQLIGPMKFDFNKINPNYKTTIVDGGLNHGDEILSKISALTTSIGDNDSNNTQKKIEHQLHEQKDFNDFSAALELNADEHNFYCLGFLGNRTDHEFANLFEAKSHLKESGYINFEDKIIVTNKEYLNFSHQGIFSLFCFESAQISLDGEIEYKMNNQKLKPFSSHGLSNKSFGDFTIENPLKQIIIIFLN